jgi:hypothetical protein
MCGPSRLAAAPAAAGAPPQEGLGAGGPGVAGGPYPVLRRCDVPPVDDMNPPAAGRTCMCASIVMPAVAPLLDHRGCPNLDADSVSSTTCIGEGAAGHPVTWIPGTSSAYSLLRQACATAVLQGGWIPAAGPAPRSHSRLTASPPTATQGGAGQPADSPTLATLQPSREALQGP